MADTAANRGQQGRNPRRGETRVDPPHPKLGDAEPAATAASARSVAQFAVTPSGESATAIVGQIRAQATQISKHLAGQQQNLDRREAEVHARTAAVETEIRSARLWMNAREEELRDHEQELAAREAALRTTPVTASQVAAAQSAAEKRLPAASAHDPEIERLKAQLAAQTAEIEKRHRQIDERQAQLYQDIDEHALHRAKIADEQTELERLREQLTRERVELATRRKEWEQCKAELERQRSDARETALELDRREAAAAISEDKLAERQREIETALLRFERMGVTEERLERLAKEAAQFQARRKYLDEAEKLLGQQQEELRQRHTGLESEREQRSEQVRRDLRKILQQQQRGEAEVRRERDALRLRAEQLDGRESTLEQLRSEIARMQREALEMRLATEELWSQLSGALAPASLTRSLAQIRGKLAEHYRLTDKELADRRAELEALNRTLTEKHAELTRQHGELQEWVDGRREEIEQQAARLVAREQELDRQQVHYESEEMRWSEERDEYRREIRALLGKLRTTEAAVA